MIVLILLLLFCLLYIVSYDEINKIEKFGINNNSMAKYRVTFISYWGNNKSQINSPKNPHTGNMFLTLSNDNFKLFEINKLATKAISNTSIYGEISDLMDQTYNNFNVGKVYTASVLSTPNEYSFIIEADSYNRHLSFITKIAPSPDWFAGVSNTNLIRAGNWVDNLVVPLFVYDAGTICGNGFNDKNYIRPHPNPISLKNDLYLYPDGILKPIAYLVIQKIN